MFLKGIYAGKPAFFQLFVLLLLVLFGAIFSSLIAMGIFYMVYGFQSDIMQYPDMMRLLQLISAVGTFLFPAVALAWTCSNNPKEYLSIGKIPKGQILLLTLVSIFLLSPSISLVGLLNKQMELPSFMEPVENWMRAQEKTAEELTLMLLAGKGIVTLLFNLLVIALAAGITEEFLFRGAVQRVIGGWTRNHHIIIWSAAILFSAFHMQFFGFLPRMLLGAYFGYLLYWGRNIWIPVFAHFTNNAFAVISMSDAKLKDNEFITGDISAQNLLPYTVIAIISLFLFYACAKKIKQLTAAKN
ncbi:MULTISPECIES: CPBP family intramembrane glutamic endopeptidase [unclassified Parabacteroides]|uniref:CPBP family intramembrane glutamic endopeptidase n=1 Tax=unclassified Parabacteroides TaxID=2649774 RepID=UPI000F009577|nr:MULTISPECIES: CPBP family intramembrane glutamic endopeptidase [unclassified Parabacteroides]RHO72679.1 CPBP family intramembrane metalloprotease [Parabacteroides sp. AF48-14]RHR58895.1 CPBP family intramembrane metalloprotease [Parabacteroides sp. AF17-28]